MRAKLRMASFSLLAAFLLLVVAMVFGRTQLAWLFNDASSLHAIAWEKLLAQKMQPVFTHYYLFWDEPLHVASARAAAAAAVLSQSVTYQGVIVGVVGAYSTICFYFLKSVWGLIGVHWECVDSKRSE